jgi:hypothetical protein
VVLVFDVSGTMAWKWRRLQEGISALIRFSPEDIQFSLIIFGGRVLEKIEFGHSRQEILSAINEFTASPARTERALRDSLTDANDLLHPARSGDSVLVATDETNDDSKVSTKAIERALSYQGIRFFLLRIVDRYIASQGTFDKNEMELLSEATGGATIVIDSPNQIELALKKIADEIAQYYLLQIALPAPLEKEGSVHIEIVNSSSRKRRDVELRFPQKLPACSALMADHP